MSSAGLFPSGRAATDHAIATMADRGLDLETHRSHRLDTAMVQRADLVIGMAREHVREVAIIAPEALGRCFTLKELVRGGEAVGARKPSEPFADWLGHLSVGRRREDLVGVGHNDAFDIRDPAGSTRADYEVTADEIDGLLGRFIELVWPGASID